MSYYIDESRLSNLSATRLLDFRFEGEPYVDEHNLRRCGHCGEDVGLLQERCPVCDYRAKSHADMNLARHVRDWRYRYDSLYRRKYLEEEAVKSSNDNRELLGGVVGFFVGGYCGQAALHSLMGDKDFNLFLFFFGAPVGAAIGMIVGSMIASALKN